MVYNHAIRLVFMCASHESKKKKFLLYKELFSKVWVRFEQTDPCCDLDRNSKQVTRKYRYPGTLHTVARKMTNLTVLEHILHLNGFLSLWIRTCFFRSLGYTKDLTHLPHLYFPFPLVAPGTKQLFFTSLKSASLQPLPSVGLKREKTKYQIQLFLKGQNLHLPAKLKKN